MPSPIYNDSIQAIIQAINCPHQVFLETSTPEEVNQAYQEALLRGKKEGFTPILVVADHILARELPSTKTQSKESILQKNLNGEELLKTWYQESENHLKTWYGIYGKGKNFTELLKEETASDSDSKPPKKYNPFLTSFIGFRGKDYIDETILFEIPVTNPWEVIAWVPIGGWNQCPNAPEMLAICKKWYQQCGAVPAVLSHDTMEFLIEHPIQEKQTAYEIAKEHYVFCPDCLDQCTATGTLADIAHAIYQSSTWFFWWD